MKGCYDQLYCFHLNLKEMKKFEKNSNPQPPVYLQRILPAGLTSETLYSENF